MIKAPPKRKTSASTTRSTAGPGFDFEDRMAAYFLLSMLLGESLPGLPLSKGDRILSQAHSLGWEIDDLVVSGQIEPSGRWQLAVSCKASEQVTAFSVPASFVAAAWSLWSKPNSPLLRATDRIMLATRQENNDFQRKWADIKNWASPLNPELGLARIAASAAHQRIFDSIKKAVRAIDGGVSDTDLIVFVASLEIYPTTFQLANSSHETESIGRCRWLLANGDSGDAEKLWRALVQICSDCRLGHGTIDLATVWNQLAVNFDLKDHANYAAAWAILHGITANYLANVQTTLPSDIQLPRLDQRQALTDALTDNHVLVVTGESGAGKSALAKAVLDQSFPHANRVWFGTNEIGILDELRRLSFGLRRPAGEVFATTSHSQNVLVLDAVEHWGEEDRIRAKTLVASLLAANSKSGPNWTIVIIGQNVALTSGAAFRIANSFAPKTISVPALEADDVETALSSVPSLKWAAGNSNVVKALRNLKALAWVVEAALRSDALSAASLSSLPTIACHLWEFWTEGHLALKGLAMRLAVADANFQHSFEISSLPSPDNDTLQKRPAQMPLRVTAQNHVQFEHDLAAEWIRFQWLLEQRDKLTEWAHLATNPFWIGALRMLGASLLRESRGHRTAWDEAFEQLNKDPATQPAADVLLDALSMDSHALSFLNERGDFLLKSNGQILLRLLKRFQHVATIPGGNAQAIANALKSDASLDLYIEAQFRTPIISMWPSLAIFLHAHMDKIAALTSPVVASICEKWLTTVPVEFAPGVPVPYRKQFAELALASAKAAQFEFLIHRMRSSETASPIYSAALAAAPDLPDEVASWALSMARRRPMETEIKTRISAHRAEETRVHQERLKTDADYRERHSRRYSSSPSFISSSRKLPPWPLGPQGRVDRSFRDVCTSANALELLIKVNPAVAAEVLLGVVIEDEPEEDYGRLDEHYGMAYHEKAYPTAYWKSPFLRFLQLSPAMALQTLIQLVDFATDRWASDCEGLGYEVTETSIRLEDGTVRTFVGNARVFCWSQEDSNFINLHSDLTALERWLELLIESGSDVAPWIDTILRNAKSAAFLGVLLNIAKLKPQLFLGALRCMSTDRRFYVWDRDRVANWNFGFSHFQWAQQGEAVWNLATAWKRAPHRNTSLQTAIIKLVTSNVAFSDYLASEIEKWPLPEDSRAALSARFLAAQLDGKNYKPGADGSNAAEPVFVCPKELSDAIEKSNGGIEHSQRLQELPTSCRQALDTDRALTPSSFDNLQSALEQLETTTELDENIAKQARVAAAAVMLVKGKDWLASHKESEAQAGSIINDELSTIPDDESRLPRSEFEWPTLDFVTYVLFDEWLNNKPGADARCLKLLTSGDRRALNLFCWLAYRRRAQLGDRWWRLLYLCALYAGLSILRPRGYDEDPAQVARWVRWRNRCRQLSLSKPSAAEKIDFVSVAKRVERFEQNRLLKDDGSPRRLRSIGLDWSFIESAFGWLTSEHTSSSLDAFDIRLLKELWRYEVWLNHRDDDDDERESRTGRQLSYSVIEQTAKQVARADAESARELWEPILVVGAPAHYSVGHFLSCWFLQASQLSASEFAKRWHPMVEFCLAAPTITNGKPWYYGLKLLRQVLGFGSESLLKAPELVEIVHGMRGLYEKWAMENLHRDEDNIRGFCYFLSSPVGKPLRVVALQWIDASLRDENGHLSWYRSETGTALVEYLNTLLTEDVLALKDNADARTVFLGLVAALAAKQTPNALALQERAKKAL